MRTVLRTPLLLFASLLPPFLAACSGATSAPRALPPLHTDGRFFKDPAGHTVVLRGVSLADLKEVDTLRAPMNVARLLDLVSDESQGWYARVVRLVVYPPDWRPDPEGYFQTILKPAVAHATARGLYAIVDWHEIGDAAPADEETRAFWAKAAPAFASYPNVLYELFNEAEDLSDQSWATWKNTAQPWVDQIRRDAPAQVILIGAPFYTQQVGGAVDDPFVGENLAYVGHIYPGIDRSAWDAGGAFTRVAGVRPMMITEWGYRAAGPSPVTGDQAGFGDALKRYLETQRLGWTAWCADTIWESAMFDADWKLRTGGAEMGGFTKDWLAERKNDDQPGKANTGTGGAGTGGSGTGGAGTGGAGTGGSGGPGGSGGQDAQGGTSDDGGVILLNCDTHADQSSCEADLGCYWSAPDCHRPTAVCSFKGGVGKPCP